MKVSAGIVLYEPNINILTENIMYVVNQVDLLIVIDNNSNNIDKIECLLNNNPKIYFCRNTKNEGIAKALNQIIDIANKENVDWLLTLDQDSVVCQDFVDLTKKYMNDTIAIITPEILDRSDVKKELIIHNNGNSYVDECITSGSFMNLKLCNIVGKFDEKMFIDYVDFEYCYRVRKAGFKILKNTSCTLLHQLGDGCVRSLLWKKILVSNHNQKRYYFIARNCVYIMKKDKRYLSMIYALSREFVIMFLYEHDRLRKIKSMFKGVLDGFVL